LGGTSFNPNPTELKFTHFKNPKVFEIIGKGGKDFNLIPLRVTRIVATNTGRAEAAGNDIMRGRFEVRARVVVELRLPVVNLLLEVAIEARS